jgi:protein arginine kinase activator
MLSDFAKTGRLGCPTCYEAFMGQLRPILRKTHGSTTHTGRRPGENHELREERRELRRLRGELARAIRQEEYEAAADLRDRIKALQTTARASGGASS